MARPEKPIQPGHPVADFALALRALRDGAGRPSYAAMAPLAFASPSVLSEAAGGRSLPSRNVMRGYVRACEGNEAEWLARWEEASALVKHARRAKRITGTTERDPS